MTHLDSTTTLQLRLSYANAMKELRAARDAHKLAAYRSADGLIREVKDRLEGDDKPFDMKVIGANESDRERAYALFAANDPDYVAALADLRMKEYEADRLTQTIRAYEDDLFERQLAVGFTNLRVLKERAS